MGDQAGEVITDGVGGSQVDGFEGPGPSWGDVAGSEHELPIRGELVKGER